MDASVLSALVGLIGVGAGAGATFGGVVYQQRHGTREARAARLRGEAVAAAEKILAELLAMQHSLRLGSHGATEEERRDYARILQHHHATIQLHSQWLPDAELRSRVTVNALYTQVGPVGDSRSDVERRGHGMALCADSIACLGAYLRSEAVPVRDAYVDQILARWPEGSTRPELHTFIVSGPSAESDETPASSR